MHVLVGGWSLLAAGITWLTMRRQSPPLRQMMPALVVAALLALLGLVPAVAMSLGVEAEIVREAKRIYVFERIPHHLWPQSFAAQRIWRYLALLLLYGALLPLYVPSVAERRVRRFVAAAIGFSITGVLLALALQAFPTVAASVMRFYWFRLADAMLPLGVALTAVGYLAAARQMAERRTAARVLVGLMLISAIGHFGHLVVNERLGAQVPRPERSQRTLSSEDWQAVCQWVAAHTPPESRVITPRQTITFLWRTERRQTPTWKDVPQSPRDIVLWRDQLEALHGTGLAPPADRWFASVAERGTERAIELAREFEAQYILTYVYPRLALPVVYQNNSYCVYAVPRPPEPE